MPEANPINFAAHVRAPKMMSHGRYGEDTPLKTQSESLFKLLREPKHIELYEGGHVPPTEFLLTKMTAWLDKTMGTVRSE